jgi:adenylate cyclase
MTGDGLLVAFISVADALRCATEVQAGVAERNALVADKRIEFRIGINMGDIVVEDGDIFGDGVNVAARLEGLANRVASTFRRACRKTPRVAPVPLYDGFECWTWLPGNVS